MSSEASPKYLPVTNKFKIWFLISGCLLLFSLMSMIASMYKYHTPVLLGLDFTGGSKIEYKFANPKHELTTSNVIAQAMVPVSEKFARHGVAQIAENNLLIFKTQSLSYTERESWESLLRQNFGEFEIISVDTVSPVIREELLSSGLIALLVTILGIASFVGYRFRRDFAICTLLALFHDVFIVIGFFAFAGVFFAVEVDSLFLTACLTIFGFSVHDTIVVFDRVRENLKYLSRKNNLAQIIDQSVTQVWFRSFGTTVTVLFVLGSLLLFGGDSTRVFSGAMFIGMLCGTYSSIFVASVFLFIWDKFKNPQKYLETL